MPKQEVGLLQPKQLEFGKLLYKVGAEAATWLGFGGARAGGKSGGLRRLMLDRRYQRPGTKGAIVRRIYKDVKENHIDKIFEEYPYLRQHWKATDNDIILPNGSRICFRYAENQQAVDQSFWGPEFYDIFVDQAEQFTERELMTIKTANRWPDAAINDCKCALFFNPGGVGTEFLRRVFYTKQYRDNERASDYAFVHVYGWDNFVWFSPLGMKAAELYALPEVCGKEEGVSPEYKCCRYHLFVNRTAEGRKLDTLPPSLRAGHLLGSFASFAGQYFAGVWDESKLILTAQQEERLIQPWWTRWMAHDDGFVHHACILWAVTGKVSPRLFREVFGVEISEPVTVVVCYRNLTESEIEQGELIRMARRLTPVSEAKTMSRYFLSPDAWERDSHGHSVAERITQELRRVEVIEAGGKELKVSYPQAERADNNRVGGWRYLYACMKKTCDVMAGAMNATRADDDFEAEAGGYSVATPLLFISGNCGDVIEAVPLAVRDDRHAGRGEDVLKQPTRGDDICDTLRYLVKSMLNPSRKPADVEAKEVWGEMTERELSYTEKAIRMRKMEHAQRSRSRRRSAWAVR